MKDEKFKLQFEDEDRTKLESLIEKTVRWIDGNPNESAEIYEEKLKLFENEFHPIMTKIYSKNG